MKMNNNVNAMAKICGCALFLSVKEEVKVKRTHFTIFSNSIDLH